MKRRRRGLRGNAYCSYRCPPRPFDPRVPETRQVFSDCTIAYHGAHYSVPYHLVGKRLTVKVDPDGACLEIFDGADWVARHLVVAKGQRAIQASHAQALRQARWDRVHARRASALVPAVLVSPTPT